MKTIITLAVLIAVCFNPALAKNEKNKNKSHSLPPGLQKKLDRGGSLPPGWQKKLVKGEVLEEAIYQQSDVLVPADSSGLLTVRVEDKVIRLMESTREIVDVLDLLNR